MVLTAISRCGVGGQAWRAFCLCLCVAVWADRAAAQNADGSNVTPAISDRLPRPGYEPRNIRIGNATIATELAFEARYDSNIYAVSTAAISDAIFLATPRVLITGGSDRISYDAQAFADFRVYAEQSGENQTTFGVTGGASYSIDNRNQLVANARFQRLAETRNDPEANTNLGMPPRLADLIAGEVEYAYTTGRIELELRGSAGHLGYLSPEDAERSLATYYLAVRGTVVATPAVSVFVQPYVNFRNFDLAFDAGGIDRDMATIGVIGGIRLTTAGRWNGQIGVGAFHANPYDATLKSFSGFASSANLIWSPQPRTTVTLKAATGDSATVRAGAIGRYDSVINVQIDQEVRHNLRFAANAGYQRTQYRGLPNTLRTTFFAVQLEYLMNRTLSVFVSGNYATRSAFPVTDGFDRTYAGLGLRFRH